MIVPSLTFREIPVPEDREAVRAILDSSGFFHAPEVDVAVELVDTRLEKGESSGYWFLFADAPDGTVGFTCFGDIPCTRDSWDLYWIAVRNDLRGCGLGRELLARSEASVTARHGRAIYIETSGRADYLPTRRFYERQNYTEEALLKDFYAPGDDKVIYIKRLVAASR